MEKDTATAPKANYPSIHLKTTLKRSPPMRYLMVMLILPVWSISIALPTYANAASNPALFKAITDCWDAVDNSSLGPLAAYGMTFERAENPRPTVENNIWAGLVRSDIGDIEVRAIIRNGVLFDCTLLTFPEPPEDDLIEYDEAMDTLRNWYESRVAQSGYFDTLSDVRFFGLTRCIRGEYTIVSSAMNFGITDPIDLQLDSNALIEGALRFSVYRGNPLNHESCAGSGAL